ncbi:5-hydroxytryptamine receptor 2B [Labeo rohita]|uniref:5-hydroxytryptamine receptor 2B n=1 Tax=Labeo rohita TaxID=84645 RepID=A0ABQ8M4T6_LABRO|nr:5-hydroxytryptamine receptor 2B [Labeo rohita]
MVLAFKMKQNKKIACAVGCMYFLFSVLKCCTSDINLNILTISLCEQKKTLKNLYKTFVFFLYIQLHSCIKTEAIKDEQSCQSQFTFIFITPGGHMKKNIIHNHGK